MKPRKRIVTRINKEKVELIEALIHVTILSVIIVVVAYLYAKHEFLIAPIIILLGFFPLVSLKLAGFKIREAISEIVFGAVNTGLITLMAIGGFEIGGILGAVIGVAVGDAITEGLSGVLEGEVADILMKYKIKEKINPLTSSLGKMSGALFGGGIVLLIFAFI